PLRAKRRFALHRIRDTTELAALPSPLKLQHVEPDPAVDHIDEPAVVERRVVALRRDAPASGLRDETPDLARVQRIGDIDDAQPSAEPDRVHDRARHALAKLMRAEARAAGAAERRVELAHLELPE